MPDDSRRSPQRHVDDESWERLALGELAGADRDRVLDHASRCAGCSRILRGLVELERGVVAVDAHRSAVLTRQPAGSPVWLTFAAAAAAAALVAVSASIALSPPTGVGTSLVRSGAESRPKAIAPVGLLRSVPAMFRWQGLDSSFRFTIELLDRDGELLWRSDELVGTETAWPADVPALPGRYYWRVWSADEDGRTSASPMTAFDLPPP